MIKTFETTTDLNVRSGPGIRYEILDTLQKGDIIEEIPLSGWCAIDVIDEEGIASIGWVSYKYLKEVDIGSDPTEKAITGKQIVNKAMTQNKDPYIFAYEVNLADPNPKAFDCSELVEWDCAQLGVIPKMPDGAANQYEHCKKHNTLISIEQAVKTPGALLFRISSSGNHVVISRGDGSTIEAKGSAYGVGVFRTEGRGWTNAALIPGVIY